MSAGSVTGSTAPNHRAGAGSSPSPALQSIRLKPIPFTVAKKILARHHYLHSLPGGTKLTFGIFSGNRLLGAITFGAGPHRAYQLVRDATPDDCMALTRLWLSDELPNNSESRVIGIALRALRKFTKLKFLVSYADPSQGHEGIVYQATNWLYTGLSETMPLYDLGDGQARHSRSFAHCYGTHSSKYFESRGINIRQIPQTPKHRYVYFLDLTYRNNLVPETLPYPKKESK